MINLSDSNEFYVVKFDNDQYLIVKRDRDGDFYGYDVISEFDEDMFFRNYDGAKCHADNFMKCNKNITHYKMSSYTIHKVEYTQTVKEIEP